MQSAWHSLAMYFARVNNIILSEKMPRFKADLSSIGDFLEEEDRLLQFVYALRYEDYLIKMPKLPMPPKPLVDDM
jgi:hypothetical protein